VAVVLEQVLMVLLCVQAALAVQVVVRLEVRHLALEAAVVVRLVKVAMAATAHLT
jgi:hypothetical protein